MPVSMMPVPPRFDMGWEEHSRDLRVAVRVLVFYSFEFCGANNATAFIDVHWFSNENLRFQL